MFILTFSFSENLGPGTPCATLAERIHLASLPKQPVSHSDRTVLCLFQNLLSFYVNYLSGIISDYLLKENLL